MVSLWEGGGARRPNAVDDDDLGATEGGQTLPLVHRLDGRHEVTHRIETRPKITSAAKRTEGITDRRVEE